MFRLAKVEIQVHFLLLGNWFVLRDVALVLVEAFFHAQP